jgi:hypothetical protein
VSASSDGLFGKSAGEPRYRIFDSFGHEKKIYDNL